MTKAGIRIQAKWKQQSSGALCEIQEPGRSVLHERVTDSLFLEWETEFGRYSRSDLCTKSEV